MSVKICIAGICLGKAATVTGGCARAGHNCGAIEPDQPLNLIFYQRLIDGVFRASLVRGSRGARTMSGARGLSPLHIAPESPIGLGNRGSREKL